MSFSVSFNDNYFVFEQKKEQAICLERLSMKQVEVPSGYSPNIHLDFISLLGLFKIDGITFAAFATSVENVSTFWDINRIKTVKILQVSPDPVSTDALALLKQGFDLTPLYYSTSHDLSLSLGSASEPRIQFIWNHKGLEQWSSVAGPSSTKFSQPIIAGFVASKNFEGASFVLISRRSNVMAGTRFWMRGVDESGHVANFVETEQILSTKDKTFSLTQIRGSIPIHWSQYPDLSRNPHIEVASSDQSKEDLAVHFSSIRSEYGPVTVLCLTNQNGAEGAVTKQYTELASITEGVRFEFFDFHKECRGMKFGNADKLIQRIQNSLDSTSWTTVDADGKVLNKQSGVVRTNCIDCLDRTNVVQSMIAEGAIKKQIEQSIGKLDYRDAFRNIWTDNADALSLQYAGTPALKTDFTRTGKRTIKGALDDGKNAVMRYYVNTCCDGTRQDAYDAVTQSVEMKAGEKNGFIVGLFFALYFFVMSILFLFIKGKKEAKANFKKARQSLVNSPRYRRLPPPRKD